VSMHDLLLRAPRCAAAERGACGAGRSVLGPTAAFRARAHDAQRHAEARAVRARSALCAYHAAHRWQERHVVARARGRAGQLHRGRGGVSAGGPFCGPVSARDDGGRVAHANTANNGSHQSVFYGLAPSYPLGPSLVAPLRRLIFRHGSELVLTRRLGVGHSGEHLSASHSSEHLLDSCSLGYMRPLVRSLTFMRLRCFIVTREPSAAHASAPGTPAVAAEQWRGVRSSC
jgi:hypothetical protein